MNAAPLLGTTLIAALAGFGAQRWVTTARPADGPDPAAARELAELVARIQELRGEHARLSRTLEQRAAPIAAPEAEDGVSEAAIAAALARWRAAHPEGSEAADGEPGRAAARPEPETLDLASIPIEELVQALGREGFTHLQRQELFQKLREAGRIDEYVAAIEALAAANPDDPELQVALGHAYLQKLFGLGNSPEAGPLAYRSDAAFDRALELDEDNWNARFSKAVSLSNWPDFMGRGPEAIEHFEILLEQQAALPPQPEFALTYLFLGNMLQAAGEREEAIATWRAGLALFPGMEELQRALALAEGQR